MSSITDVFAVVRSSPLAILVMSLALVLGVAVVGAWFFRKRLAAWLAAATGTESAAAGLRALSLLFVLGVMVLLAGVQVIASLGHLVGVSVGPLHLAVALAVALGVVWWASGVLCPAAARRAWVVSAAILLIAIVASAAWAGLFFDVSWDGNATYQEAVVRLSSGWNPMVRQPGIGPDRGTDFWIEIYPKGSWVDSAAFYAVTGRLEQSKAPHVLLILASAAAWFALMTGVAPRRWRAAATVSAIVALNPITTTQVLTFMYDGEIASILFVWVALAGLLWIEEDARPVLAALAAATLMLCTIKYTALAYVLVLAGALMLAALWRRPRGVSRRLLALALSAALLIGLPFVGFNPYVLNTVEHGSPLYPIVGPGALDLMSAHSPGDFVGKGRLTKLGLSLFSEAADVGAYGPGTHTQLKLPFTMKLAELRPFAGPTTRVSGFGPLFGGALLLGLAAVALLLVDRRLRRDPLVVGAGIAWVAILATVLINPESWWARYTPQIWLVPVIPAAVLLLRADKGWRRALAYVTCTVLLVDALLVGGVNLLSQVYATQRVSSALAAIKTQGAPVDVQLREFVTSWVKFKEAGIAYRIVPDDHSVSGGVAVPYLDVVVYPAGQGSR